MGKREESTAGGCCGCIVELLVTLALLSGCTACAAGSLMGPASDAAPASESAVVEEGS